MDDTARERWLAAASAVAALYAAMLSATIAGQLGGMGIDALMGAHHLWIPIAFSVVLESIAGARAGASRTGRPLTPGESGRVSATYSLALLLLSALFAVWISASHPGKPVIELTFGRVILALGVLIIATFVRWLLMLGFAPRPR